MAFWRTGIGALLTAPVVALRHRHGVRSLSRAGWRDSLVAGLLLAAHFGTWLTSLRMTSVTAATALVDTTPVWTVLLDLGRRAKVPGRVMSGVLLAMAGVFAITGVDAGRSSRALLGDLLALTGGITYAGYVVAGHRVRREASTAVYTTAAYAACALALLPICLLTGTRLGGYDTRAWVELGAVTLGAQMLGHTLLNAALPMVGRTPLALATLLEVPGAALIAWAWLGQVPPLSVLPGTVLMLAGLVVVVARAGTADDGRDTAGATA